MSETSLAERADALFAFALERTEHAPGLAEIHRTLLAARERLRQPMRVAIVGLIKAGKSTMMNALLGQDLVATGTVEATFNVNWLRYDEHPSLAVHFKDGSPSQKKPLAELERLTRRTDGQLETLRKIKYIEVFYPNPILQTLNLIDTPGLASVHEDDSQNTKDFILTHGEELSEITQSYASNADAVLYLFSKSLSASGQELMEQFQGPAMGNTNPINSIGVLTKMDVYWSGAGDKSPMDEGRQVTNGLLANHPQVRSLFYGVYTVCGLLAFGAQTLTPEEFSSLRQLAALPAERLDRLVQSAERITRDYPDVPTPPAKRALLLNRLGQYGIWLACKLIRSGITDQERLKQELLKQSGLPELRAQIISHFGNRAILIKLDGALRQLEATFFWARTRLESSEDRQRFKEATGRFEAMRSQEHAFQELRVLRDYYEGKLTLSEDEAHQLLAVTGEYGTSCQERLEVAEIGISTQAFERMRSVAQARIAYWSRKALDPAASPSRSDAARVLVRSYERIRYHVDEAEKHLRLYL